MVEQSEIGIQWSDHYSGNGHLPATFPAVSSDSELLKVPALTDLLFV